MMHRTLAALQHNQRALLGGGKLPDFGIIVLVLAAAGVKQEPAKGQGSMGLILNSNTLASLPVQPGKQLPSLTATPHAGTHLNGESPGLRSFVMDSKERPFFATNSASLSATFCTSGSAGGGGSGGSAAAAGVPSEAAAPHGHGQAESGDW
jgi:hypothetical protein